MFPRGQEREERYSSQNDSYIIAVGKDNVKMEKKQMIDLMRSETGSLFITRSELARVMGYKDAHCVDRYLNGLERVEKKYFIPDVVMAIKGVAVC